MYCNLFTAWYCLGVLALWLLTYLILLPMVGADRAEAAFAWTGFFGLLPFFWFIVFRKEKYDERDLSFVQRSMFTGSLNGMITTVVVAAALSFVYDVMHGLDFIPMRVFWLPIHCGLFVSVLAGSVHLILLYHKGEDADKGMPARRVDP